MPLGQRLRVARIAVGLRTKVGPRCVAITNGSAFDMLSSQPAHAFDADRLRHLACRHWARRRSIGWRTGLARRPQPISLLHPRTILADTSHGDTVLSIALIYDAVLKVDLVAWNIIGQLMMTCRACFIAADHAICWSQTVRRRCTPSNSLNMGSLFMRSMIYVVIYFGLFFYAACGLYGCFSPASPRSCEFAGPICR